MLKPTLICTALALRMLGAQDLRRDDALAVIELQPRIDAAIDRGVAWLLDQQQRDGSYVGHNAVFTGGQTALSAYTLMKAGVPPSHQGVRRALTHLTTIRPKKVYAAGTMLMAFAESGDSSYRPHMERIVADLLEWQRGTWPYPIGPGDQGLHGDQDLSITQFALLGLRAAARVGIKVPADVWLDALRTSLRYQEKPRAIEVRDGKVQAAGFHYHLNSAGNSTGAMTTAGLSALWIARSALGKLPPELARNVDEAIAAGRAWLDVHFDIRDNPGHAGQRWTYYLYGLERASALLEVAYWSGRPWYLDGARVLLDQQTRQGSWVVHDAESDTCFAILFLERATAPATGKQSAGPQTVTSEVGSEVAFKLVGRDGGQPFTLILTQVGPTDGTRTYLIDNVEFAVDDATIGSVNGKGRPFAPSAEFAARWQPTQNGKHRCSVRVRGRRADADGKAIGDELTLESRQVAIDIKEALEDWMLPAATWRDRNLLERGAATATASSELDGGRSAGQSVDGFEGTSWVCAKDDPAPRLSVVFDKPVAARTLQVTQANGARGWRLHFDLARKVHVFVNGSKSPLTADIAADELTPTRIDLGKPTRIKRLDIAVVERAGVGRNRGAVGFAEIALEK